MPETELIVIRHGETEWNKQGRWQGQNDSPLTENGKEQAQAVANALNQYNTSALYSSDLGRTVQTAHYISAATGHKIITDRKLRERHLGVFQGMTIAEMLNTYPQEFEQFLSRRTDYAMPGGESIQQRFDRSIDCFNTLAEMHKGESIVIVTHGGVLDGFFRYVTGLSLTAPRNYKIWNCALNLFSCQSGNWNLNTFGNISHLKTINTLDDA